MQFNLGGAVTTLGPVHSAVDIVLRELVYLPLPLTRRYLGTLEGEGTGPWRGQLRGEEKKVFRQSR